MFTKLIAFVLIFYFGFVTLFSVVAAIFLRKTGLLSLLLKDKWLWSVLTAAFTVSFIACGIGLWKETDWAVPVLSYTIYGWIGYLWVYNLKQVYQWVAVLKWDKANSVSQLMGRSKFFDDLIAQLIEMSKQSGHTKTEANGTAHAVTDSSLEAILDDEDFFKEEVPKYLRKKIRRKVIGLLVHTLILLMMLMGISACSAF